MRTVFILVDALRSNYLKKDNMPFLYNLKKDGVYVKKVSPNFGFCERSEILTGTCSDINGNFTAIGYDPSSSEYKSYRYILNLMSKFKCIERYLRFLFHIFVGKNKNMKIYRIPFNMLANFALTEDNPYNYGYDNINTILDILKMNNLQFDDSEFTSLSSNWNSDAIDIQDDLYFKMIYIGEADFYGHKYANDIKKMNNVLEEIDKRIENIYKQYNDGETNFVILGDHGMEPVHSEINITQYFENYNLKLGKDYDAFLDSTMIRIWIKNKNKKELILDILEKELKDMGHIISYEEALMRHMSLETSNKEGKKLYGDIIWVCNLGTIIHPDYFNGSKIHDTGMHGFFDIGENSYGLAVVVGKTIHNEIIEQCDLIDICPTICDCLGISYPTLNQGKSLLKFEEES